MTACTEDNPIRQLCVHEAGHAVVAAAVGLTIHYAFAIPYRGGEVSADGGATRKEWAAYYLAGGVAEAIAGFDGANASAGDVRSVTQWIGDSSRDIFTKRLDAASQKAREVLVRDWRAVESLAVALHRRGNIAGEEVKEIIADALTGKRVHVRRRIHVELI